MKLLGDFHTHSRYSIRNHGKNTIEEMVQEAVKIGLSAIAITDHGPGHWLFGVKRKNFDEIKAEIERLRKIYPIKILFGIEANLLSKDGKVDLSPEEIKKLDICLMGFHRIGYGSLLNFLSFGFVSTAFGKLRKKANTTAYINAIKNNNIDIITHPNLYIPIDLKAVAEAAAEKGTLIEINNRHLKFSDQDVKDMLSTKVKFIVNSDAHSVNNLGKVENALEFIKKHNIPVDRIVNLSENGNDKGKTNEQNFFPRR